MSKVSRASESLRLLEEHFSSFRDYHDKRERSMSKRIGELLNAGREMLDEMCPNEVHIDSETRARWTDLFLPGVDVHLDEQPEE